MEIIINEKKKITKDEFIDKYADSSKDLCDRKEEMSADLNELLDEQSEQTTEYPYLMLRKTDNEVLFYFGEYQEEINAIKGLLIKQDVNTKLYDKDDFKPFYGEIIFRQ